MCLKQTITTTCVNANAFYQKNKKVLWELAAISIFMFMIYLAFFPGINADDLFALGGTAADNFLSKITDLYCDKLFALIMAVTFIWLAITHNEKRTGQLITTMKYAAGAFVLLKALDKLVSTINVIFGF